jgi:exodeoxyribonuclease V gamma subunit
MVPDMSEYASLVKSIFSFNEGEPALPVYAPVSYTDEIKLTLIELFELISASPKAGTFIDFIELSYISKRFDFSEDDLSFIRTSIREQHIHHGLEVEDSAFSLEKLLLSLNSGYITEPASFELLNGVVPAEGLNGSDLFDLTTRLSFCIEILIEIRREIKDEKRPQEWLGQIIGWLNKLSVESNSRLILTLERLMDVCIAADSNQKVGFDLMKKWLVSQLNDMDATSSGMGNGVVLSSYIPYRNVPFKMVALLGMNEGVFPRNPARPVFDLINNDPKPGERITKKDDELFFLEILNSTQENLYLSYLGQELHSENERSPSVLIQKLVDTVQISKEEQVYKKEKLHGFHSSYFEETTSYSSSKKELAELSRDPAENKSAFIKNDMNGLTALENQDLYLDDLISFFIHPCKYLCINRLGVNSGFEEHETEDRELFNVSGLDRYLLEQRLFEILDMEISKRKAEEYVLSRGLIPEGIPGKKVFDDKWEEINKYRETVISFRSGERAKKEVSLNIEGMNLAGIVDDVYGNHLVHWRTGSERAKDLIKAWIQHLCLSSSDPEFEGTVLISKNKYGQIKSTHLGIIEHPLKGLKKLVDWFITAHTRKDHLCFFGESSKAFAEAEAAPDKDPLVEAYKNWEVIQFKPSEGGDFYNELIWRRQNPLEQPIFGELARQFWNPLLESIKEER